MTIRIRGRSVRGGPKDVLVDKDGRVLVVSGAEPKVYSTTGAAAISLTTRTTAEFSGRPKKLKRLAVTFSTAPTTSENLTLTQSVGDDGSRPAVVLYSRDPASVAATSLLAEWEQGYDMPATDELVLAYTNTDTRTIKAEIVMEVL